MNIVIPLGGVGERFKEEDFYNPKPLIKVKGKEIIRWVIESLKINKKKDVIYIIYNPVLDDYGFKNFINSHFPYIKLIKLAGNTIGPCDTISKVFKFLKKRKNLPFLICDGDTFYNDDIINLSRKQKVNKIFYFKSFTKNPIYSYIKIKKNKVQDIEEKIKISNEASVGSYLFKSTLFAEKQINEILKKKFTIKEYYVSIVYKQMLINKHEVFAHNIKNYVCLGTPQLVRDFENNEKKRFCFDLDNTLVTFPIKKGDYTTCKPIKENIDFLNYLFNEGHYIIINTARKMRTFDNNIAKVKENISSLTIKQLKNFKINYNELVFGKPFANIYIDDLSINSNLNLYKATGFFKKKYSLKSRKFNKIDKKDEIITKKSDNKKKIESEIDYYKKIPKNIKHFFPKITKYGKNFYQYKFIDGQTFSELLISKELNSFHLSKLFKNLNKIHLSKKHNLPRQIDIYSNYLNKLKFRINRSEIVLKNKILRNNYDYLEEKLQDYEKNKLGKIGIIHGDPVFTNMIIKDEKITFIDPRGLLKDNFSIYGDIFYDYAKIYQSLCGYDFIISNNEIPTFYLDKLRADFEKYFQKKFSKKQLMFVKYITASLYLSLVSFHTKKFRDKFNNIFISLLSS